MNSSLRRERARWLKELAASNAISWKIASLRPCLDGLTRIETNTQSLYFQDGVCVRATSKCGDTAVPCRLTGMRIVGWIADDDRLYADYVPGTRALLWCSDDDDMTVALTARAEKFEQVLPLTALTRKVPVFSPYAWV